MTGNKVDIKAGLLFPFHFLILGGVFLFAGLFLIVNHPVISGVLIFLAVLMLTSYEGTEINPEKRTVREYYSFFFVKTGSTTRYRGIEGISIHKAKVSQKMFTPRTMSSSTFFHVEYNAYLKLTGDEKIFLFTHKNKTKVLMRAQQLATVLNTAVADHAGH